jgi:hypothetical protein
MNTTDPIPLYTIWIYSVTNIWHARGKSNDHSLSPFYNPLRALSFLLLVPSGCSRHGTLWGLPVDVFAPMKL